MPYFRSIYVEYNYNYIRNKFHHLSHNEIYSQNNSQIILSLMNYRLNLINIKWYGYCFL